MGNATYELAYSVLNGGPGTLLEENTWARTGFATVQGGVVGTATLGLASRVPVLRTLPGQAAFGTGVSTTMQVAGNLLDDDATTDWNYELERAAVSGFTNVVVARFSTNAALAVLRYCYKYVSPTNSDASANSSSSSKYPPPELEENPNRPGSYGEYDGPRGKFREYWRIDEAQPGKQGWRGKPTFIYMAGRSILILTLHLIPMPYIQMIFRRILNLS